MEGGHTVSSNISVFRSFVTDRQLQSDVVVFSLLIFFVWTSQNLRADVDAHPDRP